MKHLLDSDREVALRRGLPRPSPRFAWTLRPRDQIHTPSAVFVVRHVNNGAAPPVPGSERTTQVTYECEDLHGELVTRKINYRPTRELLVRRPPKED